MKVQFFDARRHFEETRHQLLNATEVVLASGSYINGPQVVEFENSLASHIGIEHVVGVSSGSDALLMALMALGIKPGDEVITTPFSFVASASCITRLGGRPVFADIDPRTFNLSPTALKSVLSRRTKAVILVHLFGQAADMEGVGEVLNGCDVHVVEDAAQSLGATFNSRPVGSFGAMGCTSFFPTKNLGAYGDAGAILTNNEELAKALVQIRQHGSSHRYSYGRLGGNFRLDTLQAALLSVKLQLLPRVQQRRATNAALYVNLLGDIQGLQIPFADERGTHVWNQFVVRVPERRAALREHLNARGIGCEVYYPLGLHEQICFQSLGYRAGDFPNTEAACSEVLALPIYPGLRNDEIEYVAAAVRAFF